VGGGSDLGRTTGKLASVLLAQYKSLLFVLLSLQERPRRRRMQFDNGVGCLSRPGVTGKASHRIALFHRLCRSEQFVRIGTRQVFQSLRIGVCIMQEKS